MVLLGWAGRAGVDHWMSTRITYPVNMPVSLAPGHIHTGPFRLNLDTTYMIFLVPGTDWRWDQAHPDCNPYRHLQTRWALYRNGKVVDRLDEPTVLPWPSAFSAGPGVYDLDMEVLSDFSCLDSAHPYLEVIARTEPYDGVSFAMKVISVIVIYIGIALVIFTPIVRFAVSDEHSERVTEQTSVGQTFHRARRFPLRRRFSGLPRFGLFGGMTFALLAVLVMLLTVGFQRTSTGLWVRLLKPGKIPPKSDQWTEPLIVLLKDAGPGQEPNLLVNSKQVRWDDLGSVLKQELSKQGEWIVYVGGDDCIPWVNITFVIDAARADGAKVFLISHPGADACYQPPGLKL